MLLWGTSPPSFLPAGFPNKVAISCSNTLPLDLLACCSVSSRNLVLITSLPICYWTLHMSITPASSPCIVILSSCLYSQLDSVLQVGGYFPSLLITCSKRTVPDEATDSQQPSTEWINPPIESTLLHPRYIRCSALHDVHSVSCLPRSSGDRIFNELAWKMSRSLLVRQG